MPQAIDQLDPFWETRDLFERWAIWAHENEHVKQNSVFASIAPPDPDRKRRRDHNLTDERGGELDLAMAKLIVARAETGVFTKSYFLSGSNIVSIASYFCVDRKRLARIVDSGVAWLDCYLN